ncbi:uncharacterized protein LTR77_001218 [Saxophila tyrrhenica]|uniref:Uncharacterized protein n=1 Tax=Saxophila tyrrhenica TaxID=1690608 RepID=A0AAV9PJH9_9PEZI|nr:hypothetical protein LTR77_001218 [Saxophila tyrrhenica]
MRLLPPRHEGLHPALATPEPPWSPSGLTSKTGRRIIYAALLGLPCIFVGVRPGVKPVPNAKLASSVFALTFFGNTVIGGLGDAWKATKARCFLEMQDIPRREFKWFDRPGSFGQDDAILLGGVAGVLAASQLRKAWMITGWRRWTGAFVLGCGVGNSLFKMIFTRHREMRARWAEAKRQELQWTEQLEHSWLCGKRGNGLRMWHLLSGTIIYHRSTANLVPLTPNMAASISKLEHHIAELKWRRDEAARELDRSWSSLLDKEAELTGAGISGNAPDIKAVSSFLIASYTAQSDLAARVGSYGALISDSRERMKRIRFGETVADGTPATWLPPSSAPLDLLGSYMLPGAAAKFADIRTRARETDGNVQSGSPKDLVGLSAPSVAARHVYQVSPT